MWLSLCLGVGVDTRYNQWYHGGMTNRQQIYIRKDALQNLRRIHAETGESMVNIVSRLIHSEWERICYKEEEEKKEGGGDGISKVEYGDGRG